MMEEIVDGTEKVVDPEPNVTGRFECNICHKIIFSTKAVTIHKQKYHSTQIKKKRGVSYKQCELCSGKIRVVNSDSNQDNFNFPTICLRCKKMLHGKDNDELNEIIVQKRESQIPGFVCVECGRFFEKSVGLQCHIRKAHLDPQLVFYCEACNVTYATIDGLVQHLHVQTHEKTKRKKVLQCEQCEAVFSRVRKYKEHIADVHKYGESMERNNKNDKGMDGTKSKSLLKLTCSLPKCGAIFYEEDKFNNHHLVHKHQYYICRTCQCRFKYAKLLHKHEESAHSNDK
ncbi:hypothetical protein SNE40_009403 [Patella caerulea]|uniref:C2H2-type domain-containing protein n=1 Tax=Patella caerulea TaxID=87958 RepID=A0AAN8JPL3_PATCE